MNNQARGTVRARSDRLVERRVGDEVVVYDLDTDKAHLLNPVTATVWSVASGGASIDEVCEAVRAEHGADLPLDVCWAAIEQLTEAGLLASAPEAPEVEGGLSRRQLLKRAGVAAILLPTITTILAPTPAAAQTTGTCLNDGQTCTSSTQCCSGNCSGGVCACQPAQGLCVDNTDCCSGVCQNTACCNANGTSSGGSTANCCSGLDDNGTCVACKPNSTTCATNANCCSGLCVGGTCVSCIANNTSGCTVGTQCCSGICTSGTCTCLAPRDACTSNASCCSGVCTGGKCCLPITTTGCSVNLDCCGATSNGTSSAIICSSGKCCYKAGQAPAGGNAALCCSGAKNATTGLCT